MSDLEIYRRIVVNTWEVNPLWKKDILNLTISESNRFYPVKYQHGCCKNHPLVISHKAYWMNKTTLCLGYILKTNESIVRPIFRHNRRELIIQIHEQFNNTVLNRRKRMLAEAHESKIKAYVECFKIVKWPKDILDKIFELVYYDYCVNDDRISKFRKNMKQNE